MRIEFISGQEHKLHLPGAAGQIEALSLCPLAYRKDIIALLCHPHPLYGGTLHNKVITTLAHALRDAGIRSLRFNFRGVGSSEGEYAKGKGETDDVLLLMQQLQTQYSESQILLMGFSFGAYVSLQAAQSTPPVLLVSLAPAVENFNFNELKPPDCPWVVLFPEADEVVNPQAVLNWYDNLSPKPELITFPQTSHFFHGQLTRLKSTILTIIAKYLPPYVAA